MHDIRAIRENPAAFDAALARRGLPAASPEILALDADRRARIAARFSGPQIDAREASWNEQSPLALPPGKTVTVDTSGDPAYTRGQIGRLWSELSRRSHS
jgi:hypothetical protein